MRGKWTEGIIAQFICIYCSFWWSHISYLAMPVWHTYYSLFCWNKLKKHQHFIAIGTRSLAIIYLKINLLIYIKTQAFFLQGLEQVLCSEDKLIIIRSTRSLNGRGQWHFTQENNWHILNLFKTSHCLLQSSIDGRFNISISGNLIGGHFDFVW